MRHDRLKPVLRQAGRLPHGTAITVPNRIALQASALCVSASLSASMPALAPTARSRAWATPRLPCVREIKPENLSLQLRREAAELAAGGVDPGALAPADVHVHAG